MAFPSPEVERLLAAAPKLLPLVQTALRPASDACTVRSTEAAILFPQVAHPLAALAGLLLRMGCWAESHAVAQDIHSAEGSYWHGIVHRIEPDSSNAGYWFRQVGKHAIFPELYRRAEEILKTSGPPHWRLKTAWDPFLFIDWCDEAREKGGSGRSCRNRNPNGRMATPLRLVCRNTRMSVNLQRERVSTSSRHE